MTTIVIPTANRPNVLRTALSSIESQTAREQIAVVLVSESGGNPASGNVCAEFPSLPIRYSFRDPTMTLFEHDALLFAEARALTAPYVAVLNDEDWWGSDHIANGVNHLGTQPEATAYWASSFVVHGESSWFMDCWNMSCWVVTGFGAIDEVAELGLKEATLACLGSAPASRSSLIAEKHALAESFHETTKIGNPLDKDRLLFLELARKGPTLVNLVPEVFVRRHTVQDQRTPSPKGSSDDTGAVTRRILQLCEEQAINVAEEFERLYDECPLPAYRPHLVKMFDQPLIQGIRRKKRMPLLRLRRSKKNMKWMIRQLCPPIGWQAARRLYRFAKPHNPDRNGFFDEVDG